MKIENLTDETIALAIGQSKIVGGRTITYMQYNSFAGALVKVDAFTGWINSAQTYQFYPDYIVLAYGVAPDSASFKVTYGVPKLTLGLFIQGKGYVELWYDSTYDSGTYTAKNYYIDQNKALTILGTPDPDYKFDKWVLNDGTTSTNNPYIGIMDKDKQITAYFTLIPVIPPTQLTIEVRNQQAGSGNYIKVSKNGQFVNDSKHQMYYDFNSGDTATFEAVIISGWKFDKWVSATGATTTINPFSATVTQSGIITAYFSTLVDTSGYTCVDNCQNKIQAGAPYKTQAECKAACPPIPPSVATHYLDIYVKPYSWYTSGGVAAWIGKSTDINGILYNLFTGITDYQYLGNEISSIITPGYVTIRIKVRQISSIGGNGVQSLIAPALLVAIADIIVKLLIIIILVGVITGWKFTLAGVIEQISGKKYTTTEVIEIVDKVKDVQLDECNKNYTDPNTVSGCQKAVVCGAANGLSDTLSITGADCNTLGINQKVNDCLSQYNVDHDKTKYDACVLVISKNATTEAKNKASKETDWGSVILWGGLGLTFLFIATRK